MLYWEVPEDECAVSERLSKMGRDNSEYLGRFRREMPRGNGTVRPDEITRSPVSHGIAAQAGITVPISR